MLAIFKQALAVMAVVGAFALTTPGISPVCAQDAGKKGSEHTRVSGPQYVLPKDAKSCVRETGFMRRNHMDLLLHKRDQTMHNGIRTKPESLQNCINCHVTKDKAGKPIKVSNPKHFCASCHQYVAVKLDCFECHRSTPDTPAKAASIPKIPAHASLFADKSAATKRLGEFLKGVTQ